MTSNSHSAAYGLTAYRTAWLKTHFTVEFCSATMTSTFNSGKTYEKLVAAIDDAKLLGIRVSPPNINTSTFNFEPINDNTIAFGLSLVKGLGVDQTQAIINTRENRGAFTSFLDFMTKIDLSTINKRGIEALICCGAFDEIEKRDRRVLIESLDDWVISYKKLLNGKIQKRKQKGLLHNIRTFNSKGNLNKKNKVTEADFIYKEFEEPTEEEFFEKKPLVPIGKTSFIESILMEIDAINFSFNKIDVKEIKDEYKVSSHKITSKRNIYQRLYEASLEVNRNGRLGNWKLSRIEKEAKECNGWIIDETITTSQYFKYEVTKKKSTYLAVVYGVVRTIEVKTSKKKSKNSYYVLTLTDGPTSINAMLFGTKAIEMMKDINKKDMVVVMMSKTQDYRQEGEDIIEQYTIQSILKVQ